jgi:hypothetical protein
MAHNFRRSGTLKKVSKAGGFTPGDNNPNTPGLTIPLDSVVLGAGYYTVPDDTQVANTPINGCETDGLVVIDFQNQNVYGNLISSPHLCIARNFGYYRNIVEVRGKSKLIGNGKTQSLCIRSVSETATDNENSYTVLSKTTAFNNFQTGFNGSSVIYKSLLFSRVFSFNIERTQLKNVYIGQESLLVFGVGSNNLDSSSAPGGLFTSLTAFLDFINYNPSKATS